MEELHLQLRENVQPPASNMLLMRYSTELESLINEWLENCLLKEPDSTTSPQYHNTSILMAAGSKRNYSFDAIFEGAVYQKNRYTYENNSCAGYCFHYKQIVWAEATEFACATKKCNAHYFAMCLYRPAHNWPRERPYATGVSCSKCPEGYECYRNQCYANTEPVTDDFEVEPQNEIPALVYEAPHGQDDNLTSADGHHDPVTKSFSAEPKNEPVTNFYEAPISQDDNPTSAST
uniref:SCP domain-containing protein n=1 Tax=Mesocestoides corti TaxID=53468 RepID=A0A5K3FI94_MESCO